MKILNLYAGIGGNRKLWGNDNEITAVEFDEKIAQIYKENFPNDNVIVGDAHQFLLEHFREYDFIWASPPCPTHSRARKLLSIKRDKEGNLYEQNKPVYPDMKLYEEIILLQHYYNGLYCVENVIPYYEPLIKAQKVGRHLFWCNFNINGTYKKSGMHDGTIKELEECKGFDLSEYHNIDKRKILRNCVEPEVGKMFFESMIKRSNENE